MVGGCSGDCGEAKVVVVLVVTVQNIAVALVVREDSCSGASGESGRFK